MKMPTSEFKFFGFDYLGFYMLDFFYYRFENFWISSGAYLDFSPAPDVTFLVSFWSFSIDFCSSVSLATFMFLASSLRRFAVLLASNYV